MINKLREEMNHRVNEKAHEINLKDSSIVELTEKITKLELKIVENNRIHDGGNDMLKHKSDEIERLTIHITEFESKIKIITEEHRHKCEELERVHHHDC